MWIFGCKLAELYRFFSYFFSIFSLKKISFFEDLCIIVVGFRHWIIYLLQPSYYHNFFKSWLFFFLQTKARSLTEFAYLTSSCSRSCRIETQKLWILLLFFIYIKRRKSSMLWSACIWPYWWQVWSITRRRSTLMPTFKSLLERIYYFIKGTFAF